MATNYFEHLTPTMLVAKGRELNSTQALLLHVSNGKTDGRSHIVTHVLTARSQNEIVQKQELVFLYVCARSLSLDIPCGLQKSPWVNATYLTSNYYVPSLYLILC